MSSEEEDYMSEAFIKKCVKDVRPGLVPDYSKRREYDIQKKKLKINEKQRLKSKSKYNAQTRLQEGLNNPLTSENKGFSLLAKMGYKQGDALGRPSQSGITEPIGITVKLDRTGLGRKTALEDLERKKREILKRKLNEKEHGSEINTEVYRKRMRLKAEDKFIESALAKCQRTCEKLDEKENYDYPAMKWFWPERAPPEEDEESEKKEDEEDECPYESAEKLDMLTSYLRTSYNYCHWCGTQYTDSGDMEYNCPGPEKDDH